MIFSSESGSPLRETGGLGCFMSFSRVFQLFQDDGRVVLNTVFLRL